MGGRAARSNWIDYCNWSLAWSNASTESSAFRPCAMPGPQSMITYKERMRSILYEHNLGCHNNLSAKHQPDDHRRRSRQPDLADLRVLLEDSEYCEDETRCDKAKWDEAIAEKRLKIGQFVLRQKKPSHLMFQLIDGRIQRIGGKLGKALLVQNWQLKWLGSWVPAGQNTLIIFVVATKTGRRRNNTTTIFVGNLHKLFTKLFLYYILLAIFYVY